MQLQCNVDELGGKYTEAEPRCTCPPYESTLQSSQRWSTECNFSAMLTSWEASTPRRSRGVLVPLRVNIAEESVVDHRVQLQCKFDEKEGKYTEAKPRCTCPSYESNLHQVGEVQHQLPLNLMLVHFRLHLCSGYTDQYHSCKR